MEAALEFFRSVRVRNPTCNTTCCCL